MPQVRTAARLIRFAPDELATMCRRAPVCGMDAGALVRMIVRDLREIHDREMAAKRDDK
jgi:hypothetical protein